MAQQPPKNEVPRKNKEKPLDVDAIVLQLEGEKGSILDVSSDEKTLLGLLTKDFGIGKEKPATIQAYVKAIDECVSGIKGQDLYAKYVSQFEALKAKLTSTGESSAAA